MKKPAFRVLLEKPGTSIKEYLDMPTLRAAKAYAEGASEEWGLHASVIRQDDALIRRFDAVLN